SDKNLTHYQILGIPKSSTKLQIKKKFKTLSKTYHPDIINNNPNLNLSEDQKTLNNDNFIKLVNSYEVLSDDSSKLTYDLSLNNFTTSTGRSDYDIQKNKYYSNAKNYSMKNRSYPSGTYNFKKTNYSNHSQNSSHFTGKPNSGSNYDVPHFDYDKHLKTHLKFEQRLMNKKIN
ncbi:DnaJ-domain-containing protein, partial [Ascoidea rubescens DSM 1968]